VREGRGERGDKGEGEILNIPEGNNPEKGTSDKTAISIWIKGKVAKPENKNQNRTQKKKTNH
jgi:hypothetical protein